MDSMGAQDPSASPNGDSFVTVSVLPGGWITLPEHMFCDDQPDHKARIRVPSLSFLVRHPRRDVNILFDLGMRKITSNYSAAIQAHMQKRLPVSTDPDVSDALRRGGILDTNHVHVVVLSHVHYDHVGTPGDFPNADFVVGYGTRNLLQNGMVLHSAASFEADLLPADRIVEMPRPRRRLLEAEVYDDSNYPPTRGAHTILEEYRRSPDRLWKPLGIIENALDLLGDGSVYLVDSPGHIPGHLNLLARISPTKWVYLAGDACHHGRILDGHAGMGTWTENGRHVCIHVDKEKAEETVRWIRQLKTNGLGGADVEVVLAHDGEWLETHQECIWPGTI